MADENEIYQKKNGFILYKNYIKTVNKMTNEQAGELFKIILHYANTGELLRSEDPSGYRTGFYRRTAGV